MSESENIEQGKNSASHPPNHIPKTLVVVGTETALFDEKSNVRKRILASVEAFREVHIIILCGGDFPETKTEDHITLHPTNSSSRLRRIFDAVRIGRALPKADIITVQDPFETGLAGWLIAKKLGASLHVQVHTDFLSHYYRSHSLLNRLRGFTAGFVLRRAQGIRVVSDRIRDSIVARFRPAASISVLPIFVDTARFARAEMNAGLAQKFSAFKVKFLVVSRLEPEKNVALAIRSFAQVGKTDSCLIIVGDGGERQTFEAQVRELDIADRVFFEGKQEPDAYFKIADLVLFPSRYEGYGMVIIEALAAGKPVLSTDVGIAREAGATVTEEARFADALKEWLESGARSGALKNYPYKDFETYARAYQEDIAACAKG